MANRKFCHIPEFELSRLKREVCATEPITESSDFVNKECRKILKDFSATKDYRGCAFLEQLDLKDVKEKYMLPESKIYLSDVWNEPDVKWATRHEYGHLLVKSVGQSLANNAVYRRKMGMCSLDDQSLMVYNAMINHINRKLDEYEHAEEDPVTGKLYHKGMYDVESELQKVIDLYNGEVKRLEAK